MLLVGGGVVIYSEGQVELALAQVVLLGVIPHPGQLQLEVGDLVAHVDDLVGSVRRLVPAHLVQPQSLLVECNGLVQICHVEILMIHLKFHLDTSYIII